MPPKKRKTVVGRGQKVQLYNQRGEGFFGDLWSGIKKGFNFIKDNKLISGIGSLIPHPAAQRIAAGAKLVGMGKKRKTKSVIKI